MNVAIHPTSLQWNSLLPPDAFFVTLFFVFFVFLMLLFSGFAEQLQLSKRDEQGERQKFEESCYPKILIIIRQHYA
jgi:hypothetical protein